MLLRADRLRTPSTDSPLKLERSQSLLYTHKIVCSAERAQKLYVFWAMEVNITKLMVEFIYFEFILIPAC